jgi:hypothetical protein
MTSEKESVFLEENLRRWRDHSRDLLLRMTSYAEERPKEERLVDLIDRLLPCARPGQFCTPAYWEMLKSYIELFARIDTGRGNILQLQVELMLANLIQNAKC